MTDLTHWMTLALLLLATSMLSHITLSSHAGDDTKYAKNRAQSKNWKNRKELVFPSQGSTQLAQILLESSLFLSIVIGFL